MPRSIRRRRSPSYRSPPSSSTARICRSRPTPRSWKACWKRWFARLPDDLDVRILPIQAVGKSDEHVYAPGHTDPSARNMLIDAWTELGASVARAGVRSWFSSIRMAATRKSSASSPATFACASSMLAVQDKLGTVRPPARLVQRHRSAPRHPWRRCRDVADAAFPA